MDEYMLDDVGSSLSAREAHQSSTSVIRFVPDIMPFHAFFGPQFAVAPFVRLLIVVFTFVTYATIPGDGPVSIGHHAAKRTL